MLTKSYYPKKKNNTFKYILIILALIGIALLFSPIKQQITKYSCYIKPTKTSVKIEQTIYIQIEKGADLKTIINTLVSNNVLPADLEDKFVCTVKKNKLYPQFKAGYFVFKPNTYTLLDIANRLTRPNPAIVRVTIPEGLRYDQIANILGEKFKDIKDSKFSKQKFLELVSNPNLFKQEFTFLEQIKPINLEGFLYPATYNFLFNISEQQIIEQMLQAYQDYNHTLIKTSPHPLNLNDYQVLILASIIEREATGDLIEKQNIADILLKRLKANYPLQVDATLLYPQKDWTATITNQHKQQNSAYNTYKNIGLPPTPISNPGKDSVYAVLNPITNPYWYYIHGKDGKVHYAKTYSEHLQNIRLFLY